MALKGLCEPPPDEDAGTTPGSIATARPENCVCLGPALKGACGVGAGNSAGLLGQCMNLSKGRGALQLRTCLGEGE